MRPRWRDWPAILGGRFDPIHLGHLEAARGVFQNPGVRELLVMPTPMPAHKATVATARDRMTMARSAFSELPFPIRVDDRELLRHERTGRPTFSFDTLTEMAGETPGLSFILGIDQFAALPSWHRFPEVLELCHWLVLERRGKDELAFRQTLGEMQRSRLIQTLEPGLWQTSGGKFVGLFETPARACSSTEIRAEIAKTGEPPLDRIPRSVAAYLKATGLYGTRKVPFHPL